MTRLVALFVAKQQRRDLLKELQFLALVGLAAMVAGAAFGVADLLRGAPISLSTLEIPHPTIHQRVLYGLSQAPTAILLIVVLALLVLTLRRARRTDPFTPATVRNLRLMGLVLLLGISTTFVEAWAQGALSSTVNPDDWTVSTSLPIAWLFGGFLCFAIAEIVHRGCALREELAAVI